MSEWVNNDVWTWIFILSFWTAGMIGFMAMGDVEEEYRELGRYSRRTNIIGWISTACMLVPISILILIWWCAQ